MEKKKYRSFKRSEKAILRAYAELMHQNGDKRITVTDIVEKADLNRSTFYSHFKSAEDVLEKIHTDVMEELIGSFDKGKLRHSLQDPYQSMYRVIEFIKSDEELYKTMLNTAGADRFLKRIRDMIIDRYMSDEVILPHVRDRDEFEMTLRLLIGGFASVIEDWAQGSIKLSLERCAHIMSDSIQRCIESHLKK